MELRLYTSGDCPAMAALFQETIRTVNAADYAPEQLDAWAGGEVDLPAWDRSFRAHLTLVAEEAGEIIGFADMDASGYLDRLYVHPSHLRQGVATALCDALEAAVDAPRFVAHASLTARPFFLARGYQEVHRQTVERLGVKMDNFVMEKHLPRS